MATAITMKSLLRLTQQRLPAYADPSRYYRRAKHYIVNAILRFGIPLRVTTKVGDVTVQFLATSFTEYMLRAKLSYTREKVTMNWINHWIAPDDVVYDIGANVGAYSLLIGMKVASGKGKVLAFEPESANFSSLNRNILLNGLSGTVIPYATAFGDKSRASEFYLSSTVPGSAMHGVDRAESDGIKFEAKHVQGIYVVSVDEFLRDGSVPVPNHVKIDVDGSELSIVSSMPRLLGDPRLKTIMIEIAEDVSKGHIEQTLLNAGFVEQEREKWEGKNVYNVLYARPSS